MEKHYIRYVGNVPILGTYVLCRVASFLYLYVCVYSTNWSSFLIPLLAASMLCVVLKILKFEKIPYCRTEEEKLLGDVAVVNAKWHSNRSAEAS